MLWRKNGKLLRDKSGNFARCGKCPCGVPTIDACSITVPTILTAVFTLVYRQASDTAPPWTPFLGPDLTVTWTTTAVLVPPLPGPIGGLAFSLLGSPHRLFPDCGDDSGLFVGDDVGNFLSGYFPEASTTLLLVCDRNGDGSNVRGWSLSSSDDQRLFTYFDEVSANPILLMFPVAHPNTPFTFNCVTTGKFYTGELSIVISGPPV